MQQVLEFLFANKLTPILLFIDSIFSEIKKKSALI